MKEPERVSVYHTIRPKIRNSEIIFVGKSETNMGKNDITSNEQLKHQQVHQVSVHVTNNMTPFPVTILGTKFQKPFLHNAKSNPCTL